MPIRRILFPLLALLCALASAHAQSDAFVSLPWKTWSMHAGNDPRCAAVADAGCNWEPKTSDAGTSSQPLSWVRKEIDLPADLRQAPQLAILIQGTLPVYEVYVNGHLAGSSGDFTSRRGPLYTREIFVFPTAWASNGHLVVTAHLVNMSAANLVGKFQPAVGTPGQMHALRNSDTIAYLRSSWQHYLSYLLILVFCAFFVLLYLMDRKALEYLFFALALGSIGMLRVFELGTVIDIGFGYTAAVFCSTAINAFAGIWNIEFAYALRRRKVPLLFRLLELTLLTWFFNLFTVMPVPDKALTWFFSWPEFGLLMILHYGVILAVVSWVLAILQCFRSKLPEMRWIGAAMILPLFEEVNRHLTLTRLPGVPQEVRIGTLDFDARAAAYLLFSVVMLVAMTVRFRRIQRRNQTIEQEMAAAAAVQNLLLNSNQVATGRFAIETAYLPAGEVGGDFFYSKAGQDGQGLVTVVGDVSGKGLKAAMTVAAVLGALRNFDNSEPAVLLAHLNAVLHGNTDGFVTCCACRFSPDGAVTIANAGNPAPYWNGSEVETTPGLPLGIVNGVAWEERAFRMSVGDRLTFVSDGVLEAERGGSRELFGFDRTQAISRESAEAIAGKAREFSVGAPQGDDITVLTVTCGA